MKDIWNILIIGQGAREHAVANKLSQSTLKPKISVWPGNPAIACEFSLAALSANSSNNEIARYCIEQKINLVIVGPETPLANGISDTLKEFKIPCFGPSAQAAKIESSKVFAKKIMATANIPTAEFEITSDFESTKKHSIQFLNKFGGVVIKASGLAAGKGVFVCFNLEDISNALKFLFEKMSEASKEIVIERVLEGRESSYFNFVGNNRVTSLGFAVDYKRLKDSNLGPNTGGMGCYSPVPWLPKNSANIVEEKIVLPLIHELKKNNIDYIGWLYTGLMWDKNFNPYVVEFNCRLGDPETQVLTLADSTDWLEKILFHLGMTDLSDEMTLQQNEWLPSVAVVLASNNYPYNDCDLIGSKAFNPNTFINKNNITKVFGAALEQQSSGIYAKTGRVLTVASSAKSFLEAKNQAYLQCKIIADQFWPEAVYRKDIGAGL